MNKKRVAIIGAGPAGLGVAYYLNKLGKNPSLVDIFEINSYVGGNAASFESEGLFFDFGSHRLHPETRPEILQDIKSLLGSQLKIRPRNGRIRLKGKLIGFPLNFLDLVVNLPLNFSMSILADLLKSPFRKSKVEESYSDVLLNGLGPTICDNFYFPYARKIWGINQSKISAVQAHRRVSAKDIIETIKKVVSNISFLKTEKTGVFYYPSEGFGQISQVFKNKVESQGANIFFNSKITNIIKEEDKFTLNLITDSGIETNKNYDFIFSTIPIKTTANLLSNKLLDSKKYDLSKLESRSMVLVYIIFKLDNLTNYDAHYFPEEEFIFSRISEPKIYSDSKLKGKTGICAEIPCDFGDSFWEMSDIEITKIVFRDLKKAGIMASVNSSKISSFFTRRLIHAYPIYLPGSERELQKLENSINKIDNFISLGRQGLFAHDNTHHTLEMALESVNCLNSDFIFDYSRWELQREKFKDNVVVD